MPNEGDIKLFNIPDSSHTHAHAGFHSRSRYVDSGNHNNSEFWLRCTIPAEPNRAPDSCIQSVLIMLNGLAESSVTAYDDTAVSLAEYGMASIVLPLPNHFCRHGTLDDGLPSYSIASDPFQPYLRERETRRTALRRISARILKDAETDPNLWIDSYMQTISDVMQLVDIIKGRSLTHCPFLTDRFSENTDVSLYGFSLGGLLAGMCQ